ncbi:hypothetical protein D3C73_1616740 [compost metagenome]
MPFAAKKRLQLFNEYAIFFRAAASLLDGSIIKYIQTLFNHFSVDFPKKINIQLAYELSLYDFNDLS